MPRTKTRERCPAARWVPLSVGLVCGALQAAAGQSLTSGSLSGAVRGPDGAPVFDALVTVTESRGGGSRATVTSRGGEFTISLLAPGIYEVLVEHLGYAPKRVLGVPVAAGGAVRVPVTLGGGSGGAAEAEPFGGMLSGSPPALIERLSVLPFAPGLRTDVLDLARRSSGLEGGGAGEGLPVALGGFYWDGASVPTARHPAYAGSEDGFALPLAVLGTADLVTNGADVEWSGAAGPIVSAHSAHGSGRMRIRFGADGTSDALATSEYFDPGAAPGTSFRTTATVSGPLIRDSAEFMFGVDVQRLEQPRAPLWPSGALATALVTLAQDSFGLDLSGYTTPGLVSTEATTAFGRFDWRASRNHALGFHGLASKLETDLDALGTRSAGLGARLNARDLTALVALNSVLGAAVGHELRLGFTHSTRDYDDAVAPSTRIVDAGLTFGGDPSVAADVRRTSIQFADAVHVTGGRHRLKLGADVSIGSFDQTYADEATGAFVFGGTAELTSRRGVFRQAVGAPPVADFGRTIIAGFVQDRWAVAPGIDFVLGLRVEREGLPTGELTASDSLADLTGLDNTVVPAGLTNLAPRLGLRWDVGGRGIWVVRAAAGQYHGQVDPGLLAELITGDGGVRGRRGVGVLGAWPASPDSTAAPVSGPRYTLLGPDFEAPRTTRLGLTISRALGSATLHVSGSYRHTDFLPRRADLNRLAAPAGVDQYGRPLYGTLVQQGSLLAGMGNRRFTGVDRLWAVNADGYSDYWGVTVTLVRDLARGIRFLASYTHSRTTDNWLGARGGPAAGQLHPFPEGGAARDWSEDLSDFDVPDRAVVGLEIPLGPLTLSGLYRFESGAPFTPGFRGGVDANGDGADDNDPAFIDDAVSGIAPVLAAWDCLRGQSGEFAARNSCREPGSHRLDVRLALAPLRLGSAPLSLVVEALNVVESGAGWRDHALYLVDRTATLTTNPATGVVTVPLIANPAFGDVLARRTSGRTIRLGLRIGGGW
jgi:hypothetical protein